MTGADVRLWGLPLDRARERARATGWEVEAILTRPPWPGSGGGRPMVVGQRVTASGRLLLVYAHEEYRQQSRSER